MQVVTATHSQPTLPALQAQFFLSAEHAQDDLALGHAHLNTNRAQRAFRAAGVAQAWLMGRAPEIQPGKVPARVVGILSTGQVEPDLLLEHIDNLERVLRGVCGTPVKVHCFFLPSAVPTSATPVAIRGAGDRPELPIPASAPSVPPALARQASANDPRTEAAAQAVLAARARPPLQRSAALPLERREPPHRSRNHSQAGSTSSRRPARRPLGRLDRQTLPGAEKLTYPCRMKDQRTVGSFLALFHMVATSQKRPPSHAVRQIGAGSASACCGPRFCLFEVRKPRWNSRTGGTIGPMKALIALVLVAASFTAAAADIEFTPVAPSIYAFVGDTGPRSAANEGLNANLGLVVTRSGALLIDSGAGEHNAGKIHEAVRRVTSEPVRWVVNTGGQDHRWLGNTYFARLGAQLIAHRDAVPDMRSRGGDQLAALRSLLGPKMDGTQAVLPNELIAEPDAAVDLGGTRVEFRHRGGGHTPGDMLVWLPKARVLFTGDIVYADRLLAVLPVSSTRHWLQAFEAIEQLSPAVIVPGHGRVTDLPTARRETKAYLERLRAHMRKAVDEGQDISAAIRSFDLKPFQNLANAAELHPGNASRVYLELERE